MATNDKYDRQLRLWGASGQRALSETTVVLVRATAVGTETLKNLVLPGVGAIHVLDDESGTVPSSSRAFSDFFVFRDDGGDGSAMEVDGEDEKKGERKSRAEVACANLIELNPDVSGSHTTVPSLEDADYGALLGKISSDARGERLLVVASDLPPAPLLSLSAVAYERSAPLLIVRSYGLIGALRVQVRRHVVIESKPDNSVPDLRLACPDGPFPALRKLAEATDLESMDSKDHGHVPYVILLIKAMEKWRERRAGSSGGGSGGGGGDGDGGLVFPRTQEEKAEFRQVIKSMARNYDDELNFQEAYDDAYLAYATRDVPWEVQELLDAADAMQTDGDGGRDKDKREYGDGKFDVLVLALKKFLGAHGGQPPLHGSIPDMTAGTEPYVALQEAYRSKAEEDRGEMRKIVEEVRSSMGAGAAPEIADEELSAFCKNVYNLRKLETRSYAEEYAAHSPGSGSDSAAPPSPSPRELEIRDDLLAASLDPYEAPEHTPLLWHIALRAADAFRERHGHYPGGDGRTAALSRDADDVHALIGSVVRSMGLAECDLVKSQLLEDGAKRHAREVVRYHNAEVHNVASVVGGVASQEAVKLITGQYVPLDDTYVYNGIACVGGVYRF